MNRVSRGLILKTDPRTGGLRVEYARCDPGECRAVFSITNHLAKQLTAAKSVTVTIALTSGKAADVELSTDGFAGALTALASKSKADRGRYRFEARRWCGEHLTVKAGLLRLVAGLVGENSSGRAQRVELLAPAALEFRAV